MAKDPLDEMNLDDDMWSDLDSEGFDFDGDFDGDEKPVDKDGNRSPITSHLKSVGKDLAAVGEGITAGAAVGIKEKISKEFPEVENAYNFAMQGVADAQRAKDDILKQITPVLNDAKATARKFSQIGENAFPNIGVFKKISSLLEEPKDDYTSKKVSVEEMRNNAIDAELSKVFAAQAQERAIDRKQATIDRLIDKRESRATNAQLTALIGEIRTDTLFQASFMRSSATAYMKKSLELKYRHLFVAQDTLEALKLTTKSMETRLDAIKHNSALPDAQKIRLMERVWNKNKDKFTNSLSDMSTKLFDHARKKVMEDYIQPIIDNLGMATGGLDLLADMMEQNQEMGGSNRALAMSQGGSFLGGILGGRAVKALINKLPNHVRQTIRDAAATGPQGLLSMLNRVRNGEWDWKEDGNEHVRAILEKFADLVPNVEKGHGKFENKAYTNALDDGKITNKFVRTVEEIIPRYLSMQVKYLEQMVTGNKAEAKVWDWKTNKFVTETELQTSLKERVFTSKKQQQKIQLDSANAVRGALSTVHADTGDSVADEEYNRTLQTRFDNISANTALGMMNLAHAKYTMSPDDVELLDAFAKRGESSYFTDTFCKNINKPRAFASALVDLLKDPAGNVNRQIITSINKRIKELSDGLDYERKRLESEVINLGYESYFGNMLSQDSSGDYSVDKEKYINQFKQFSNEDLRAGTTIDVSYWGDNSKDAFEKLKGLWEGIKGVASDMNLADKFEDFKDQIKDFAVKMGAKTFKMKEDEIRDSFKEFEQWTAKKKDFINKKISQVKAFAKKPLTAALKFMHDLMAKDSKLDPIRKVMFNEDGTWRNTDATPDEIKNIIDSTGEAGEKLINNIFDCSNLFFWALHEAMLADNRWHEVLSLYDDERRKKKAEAKKKLEAAKKHERLLGTTPTVNNTRAMNTNNTKDWYIDLLEKQNNVTLNGKVIPRDPKTGKLKVKTPQEFEALMKQRSDLRPEDVDTSELQDYIKRESIHEKVAKTQEELQAEIKIDTRPVNEYSQIGTITPYTLEEIVGTRLDKIITIMGGEGGATKTKTLEEAEAIEKHNANIKAYRDVFTTKEYTPFKGMSSEEIARKMFGDDFMHAHYAKDGIADQSEQFHEEAKQAWGEQQVKNYFKSPRFDQSIQEITYGEGKNKKTIKRNEKGQFIIDSGEALEALINNVGGLNLFTDIDATPWIDEYYQATGFKFNTKQLVNSFRKNSKLVDQYEVDTQNFLKAKAAEEEEKKNAKIKKYEPNKDKSAIVGNAPEKDSKSEWGFNDDFGQWDTKETSNDAMWEFINKLNRKQNENMWEWIERYHPDLDSTAGIKAFYEFCKSQEKIYAKILERISSGEGGVGKELADNYKSDPVYYTYIWEECVKRQRQRAANKIKDFDKKRATNKKLDNIKLKTNINKRNRQERYAKRQKEIKYDTIDRTMRENILDESILGSEMDSTVAKFYEDTLSNKYDSEEGAKLIEQEKERIKIQQQKEAEYKKLNNLDEDYDEEYATWLKTKAGSEWLLSGKGQKWLRAELEQKYADIDDLETRKYFIKSEYGKEMRKANNRLRIIKEQEIKEQTKEAEAANKKNKKNKKARGGTIDAITGTDVGTVDQPTLIAGGNALVGEHGVETIVPHNKTDDAIRAYLEAKAYHEGNTFARGGTIRKSRRQRMRDSLLKHRHRNQKIDRKKSAITDKEVKNFKEKHSKINHDAEIEAIIQAAADRAQENWEREQNEIMQERIATNLAIRKYEEEKRQEELSKKRLAEFDAASGSNYTKTLDVFGERPELQTTGMNKAIADFQKMDKDVVAARQQLVDTLTDAGATIEKPGIFGGIKSLFGSAKKKFMDTAAEFKKSFDKKSEEDKGDFTFTTAGDKQQEQEKQKTKEEDKATAEAKKGTLNDVIAQQQGINEKAKQAKAQEIKDRIEQDVANNPAFSKEHNQTANDIYKAGTGKIAEAFDRVGLKGAAETIKEHGQGFDANTAIATVKDATGRAKDFVVNKIKSLWAMLGKLNKKNSYREIWDSIAVVFDAASEDPQLAEKLTPADRALLKAIAKAIDKGDYRLNNVEIPDDTTEELKNAIILYQDKVRETTENMSEEELAKSTSSTFFGGLQGRIAKSMRNFLDNEHVQGAWSWAKVTWTNFKEWVPKIPELIMKKLADLFSIGKERMIDVAMDIRALVNIIAMKTIGGENFDLDMIRNIEVATVSQKLPMSERIWHATKKGVKKAANGAKWLVTQPFSGARHTFFNKKAEVFAKPAGNEPLVRAKHIRISDQDWDNGVFHDIGLKKECKSVADIKGVVYNYKGEPLFTEKEYERGLITADGEPIKNLGSRLGRGVHHAGGWVGGKIAGAGGWIANKIKSMPGAGLASRAYGLIKTTVGAPINITKGFLVKFKDVYLKDSIERGPLVTAKEMKQGLVVFMDGKPIKDVYSIDRPVKYIDDPANGELAKQYAITNEHLKQGLVDEKNKPLAKFGNGLGSFIRRGVDGIGTLLGKAGGLTGKLLSGAWGIIASGGKKLFEKKDPCIDVYDSDGRLLLYGRDIKANKYVFEDGKPVTSAYIITKEVFERETKNKLVTREDIEKGLYDIDHHKLTKWRGRSIAFKALTGGFVVGKWAAGGLWKGVKKIGKFLGGVGGKIKDAFSEGAGILDFFHTRMIETIEAFRSNKPATAKDLESIVGSRLDKMLLIMEKNHALNVEQDAEADAAAKAAADADKGVKGDKDGDGVRDGSYEDQQRKKEDKTNKNKEFGVGDTINARIEKAMAGGGAAGAVGAAAGEGEEDGSLLEDASNAADLWDHAKKSKLGKWVGGKLGAARKWMGGKWGALKTAGGKLLGRGAGAIASKTIGKEAAGTVAKVVARHAARRGLMMGVGAALTATGIGAPIGTLLFVAGAAWTAYEVGSWLFSDSDAEKSLNKMRYEGYGVDEKYDDEVEDLEEEIFKISKGERKPFTEDELDDWMDEFDFSGKGILDKLLGVISSGVSWLLGSKGEKDPKQEAMEKRRQYFALWIQKRFGPVFNICHGKLATALRKPATEKIDWDEIDDVQGDDKIKANVIRSMGADINTLLAKPAVDGSSISIKSIKPDKESYEKYLQELEAKNAAEESEKYGHKISEIKYDDAENEYYFTIDNKRFYAKDEAEVKKMRIDELNKLKLEKEKSKEGSSATTGSPTNPTKINAEVEAHKEKADAALEKAQNNAAKGAVVGAAGAAAASTTSSKSNAKPVAANAAEQKATNDAENLYKATATQSNWSTDWLLAFPPAAILAKVANWLFGDSDAEKSFTKIRFEAYGVDQKFDDEMEDLEKALFKISFRGDKPFTKEKITDFAEDFKFVKGTGFFNRLFVDKDTVDKTKAQRLEYFALWVQKRVGPVYKLCYETLIYALRKRPGDSIDWDDIDDIKGGDKVKIAFLKDLAKGIEKILSGKVLPNSDCEFTVRDLKLDDESYNKFISAKTEKKAAQTTEKSGHNVSKIEFDEVKQEYFFTVDGKKYTAKGKIEIEKLYADTLNGFKLAKHVEKVKEQQGSQELEAKRAAAIEANKEKSDAALEAAQNKASAEAGLATSTANTGSTNTGGTTTTSTTITPVANNGAAAAVSNSPLAGAMLNTSTTTVSGSTGIGLIDTVVGGATGGPSQAAQQSTQLDISALGKIPGIDAVNKEQLAAQFMNRNLTRGIRNNNPMNVTVAPWSKSQPGFVDGDREVRNSGVPAPIGRGKYGMCRFIAPEYGIAAAVRLIKDVYAKSGKVSISAITHKYSPPNENDTAGLIRAYCQASGFKPNEPINWDNQQACFNYVKMIIKRESGNRYSDELIMRGFLMGLGKIDSSGAVKSDDAAANSTPEETKGAQANNAAVSTSSSTVVENITNAQQPSQTTTTTNTTTPTKQESQPQQATATTGTTPQVAKTSAPMTPISSGISVSVSGGAASPMTTQGGLFGAAPTVGTPGAMAGGAPAVDMSQVPASATPPKGEVSELGSFVSKYESGSKGSACVAYDANGGTSYGTYQLSSKQGSLKEFVQWCQTHAPEVYAALNPYIGQSNTGSKSGDFVNRWLALVKDGKINYKLEHDYYVNNFFGPALKRLQKINPAAAQAVSTNRALQEAYWSTAVQHGAYGTTKGAPGIFSRMYKQGMSTPDYLRAIYADRSKRFSDPKVLKGIRRRFKEELADMLAIDQQYGSQVAGTSGAPAQAAGGVSTGAPEATPADGYTPGAPVGGAVGGGNGAGGGSNVDFSVSASMPMIPSGPVDMSGIQLQSGIDFEGLHPAVKQRFAAMAKEYKAMFGKPVIVTSGKRSLAKQAELYRTLPRGKAARPNPLAPHICGLALDANSADMNKADSSGLLAKYGLWRPLKDGLGRCPKEAWHVEIQGSRDPDKKVITEGTLANINAMYRSQAPDPNVSTDQSSTGASVMDTSASGTASQSPVQQAQQDGIGQGGSSIGGGSITVGGCPTGGPCAPLGGTSGGTTAAAQTSTGGVSAGSTSAAAPAAASVSVAGNTAPTVAADTSSSASSIASPAPAASVSSGAPAPTIGSVSTVSSFPSSSAPNISSDTISQTGHVNGPVETNSQLQELQIISQLLSNIRGDMQGYFTKLEAKPQAETSPMLEKGKALASDVKDAAGKLGDNAVGFAKWMGQGAVDLKDAFVNMMGAFLNEVKTDVADFIQENESRRGNIQGLNARRSRSLTQPIDMQKYSPSSMR